MMTTEVGNRQLLTYEQDPISVCDSMNGRLSENFSDTQAYIHGDNDDGDNDHITSNSYHIQMTLLTLHRRMCHSIRQKIIQSFQWWQGPEITKKFHFTSIVGSSPSENKAFFFTEIISEALKNYKWRPVWSLYQRNYSNISCKSRYTFKSSDVANTAAVCQTN